LECIEDDPSLLSPKVDVFAPPMSFKLLTFAKVLVEKKSDKD